MRNVGAGIESARDVLHARLVGAWNLPLDGHDRHQSCGGGLRHVTEWRVWLKLLLMTWIPSVDRAGVKAGK